VSHTKILKKYNKPSKNTQNTLIKRTKNTQKTLYKRKTPSNNSQKTQKTLKKHKKPSKNTKKNLKIHQKAEFLTTDPGLTSKINYQRKVKHDFYAFQVLFLYYYIQYF
jgi:dGTP triphosphohydrolase